LKYRTFGVGDGTVLRRVSWKGPLTSPLKVPDEQRIAPVGHPLRKDPEKLNVPDTEPESQALAICATSPLTSPVAAIAATARTVETLRAWASVCRRSDDMTVSFRLFAERHDA
jgi:hypothetical protein